MQSTKVLVFSPSSAHFLNQHPWFTVVIFVGLAGFRILDSRFPLPAISMPRLCGFRIPCHLQPMQICVPVEAGFQIPNLKFLSWNQSKFAHWLKPDSKFQIPNSFLEIEVNLCASWSQIPNSIRMSLHTGWGWILNSVGMNSCTGWSRILSSIGMNLHAG